MLINKNANTHTHTHTHEVSTINSDHKESYKIGQWSAFEDFSSDLEWQSINFSTASKWKKYTYLSGLINYEWKWDTYSYNWALSTFHFYYILVSIFLEQV